jgi:hypothetical protein
MKNKVLRLTESELVRIVKRMISENELTFYRRNMRLINDFLDEVIYAKKAEYYDVIDYEDYKSEVLWSVLLNIEHINGEVRDVEEYFEFMNVFNDEIKKGYENYRKRRK